MPVRPINRIAAEIAVAMKDIKLKSDPIWIKWSIPYVHAMLQISSPSDQYGLEPGEDIILRFLSNAQAWRGEQARRIKAELRLAMKEASDAHN